MDNKKQVKNILNALSIGKTISFFNWKTKENDIFTKIENGFIDAIGNKVTQKHITINYRADDNILQN